MEDAVRWDLALDHAAADLAGNPLGLAEAHGSPDLPNGPHRVKMFGPGKKPTHRIVFRVTPSAVELVAVRHLAQDDLTPLDL